MILRILNPQAVDHDQRSALPISHSFRGAWKMACARFQAHLSSLLGDRREHKPTKLDPLMLMKPPRFKLPRVGATLVVNFWAKSRHL